MALFPMYVVLGEHHFEYVLSPLILTLFMTPFGYLALFSCPILLIHYYLEKYLIFKSAFLPVRFLFMFLFHHRLASPAL